jgi:hypothetical protein
MVAHLVIRGKVVYLNRCGMVQVVADLLWQWTQGSFWVNRA